MKIQREIVYQFIVLVFLSITIQGGSQDIDTNEFEHRTFNQAKIDQFKAAQDFAYVQQTPPNNLGRGLIEWLTGILKKIFSQVPEEKLGGIIQIVVQVLLWGIGIFALVMLFLGLFKQGTYNVIGRKDKQTAVNYTALEQQVIETNWPELIEEAIQNKKYKTAIRLLFLYTIQRLHNNGLITWKKDKTNREYLYELQNSGLKEAFHHLTRYYNYVWFGDVPIDRLLFDSVYQQFQQFYNTLDKHVEKV